MRDDNDIGFLAFVIVFLVTSIVFMGGFCVGGAYEYKKGIEKSNEVMKLLLLDDQKKAELKQIFDSGKEAIFDLREKKFVVFGSMDEDKSELWKFRSKDLNLPVVEETKEVQ